jgi:exoribonuclease R
MYRIFIENRDYTQYSFGFPGSKDPIDEETKTKLSAISPLKYRMFSNDVFSVENDIVKIVHSPIKTQILAGVLILHENRTYGRTKNGRLLYKCIPDDSHLPAFLVPYDLKIGFSKKQTNKYVIFSFLEWEDTHPRGIIQETIGDVSSLDAYFEYQLYSKQLHESLKEMTQKTQRALSVGKDALLQIRDNPHFHFTRGAVEDPFIFTIDPPGSTDYDDAFSIQTIFDANSGKEEYIVTVYIANVFVWLETFELWSAFSRRVSTIYLPDKRRPMLPTILSDTWCSLQEKTRRFAFAIEWHIDENGREIETPPRMFQTEVQIGKNYAYESKELLSNPFYNQLFCLSKQMEPRTRLKTSHDVVSLWMVKMNRVCAEWMQSKNVGIFRFVTSSTEGKEGREETAHLSESCQRAIHQWNTMVGQYSLESTEYIHITSPIRRLVDVLNQMILFKTAGLIHYYSKEAEAFLQTWILQLDYINTTMRSIRKVQLDCQLLARVIKETDINTQTHTHKGVVFDKVTRNDGLNTYMVYLEDLHMISKITVDLELTNFGEYSFQLYLFQDEHFIKQKVRLQLLL